MEQAVTGARNGLTKAVEIAQPEFPSTSPDAPLEQCLHLVAEDNTPVAVLDGEQRLLGVITRPVLFNALQSDGGATNES